MTITFISLPDDALERNGWEFRMKKQMKSYFTRINQHFRSTGVDIKVEMVDSDKMLGDMHELR